MSAEQSARTVSTLQQAISGSTGESNVFFQRAAGRMGLGGGTLGGTQMAVSQGLMGINMGEFMSQTGGGALAERYKDVFNNMGLTGKDFGVKMLKGIDEELQSRGLSRTGSPEQLAERARFMAGRLGVGVPEAAKLDVLAQKLEAGGITQDTFDEEIKDLLKGPTKKWQEASLEVMQKLPENIASKLAERSFAEFELGKESSSAMVRLISAETALTESIKNLVIQLGGGVSEPSTSNKPTTSLSGNLEGFVDENNNIDISGSEMVELSGNELHNLVRNTNFSLKAIEEKLDIANQDRKSGNKDRKETLKKPPGRVVPEKTTQ